MISRPERRDNGFGVAIKRDADPFFPDLPAVGLSGEGVKRVVT
jgi:hypothetical protein